ncbi:M23 family metallopeptidase, partial [Patescibacteria group bacterium]|nr:M23 family metallopeptidase [Patescibacteria group bacterium]
FKKVKKITGKIDEQLRKVNLGLPSIKRFVEDTLGIGGLPGKIISGGIGVVSAIAGVFAVPITISLAPVIIGVVGFMFVYPMLQSGMYSSLAPPQTGFGEEGGYFGEAGEGEILFEGIIPPGCPSGWPVNNGSITQGPATTYSHKGSVAESIDFGVGLGTPIMATHDGGVSCRNGRGYGVFVDLIGSCGGIDFITRYGHLIEGSAMHCGEEVTSGTVIGYANNTGNSTGNHLHYEIVSGALGDIRQFLPAPKGFEIRRGCIGFEDCGSISL